MFKLWSETNNEIQEQLKPDLGIRNWNSLNNDEKLKIWKYLEIYFFNNDILDYRIGRYTQIFEGVFSEDFLSSNNLKLIIEATINNINEKYKSKSYANSYLKEKNLKNACKDFYNIFHIEDENTVLELLSIFSKIVINFSLKNLSYLTKKENETQDDYQIRFTNYQYQYFDDFSSRLNDVFNDFGLNIILTRQGFIPKQGEKIIKEIYNPTLDFLSHEKYKEVNRDLGDAFSDYHKKDYSGTITKTISSIQAFLQIELNGQIGKGQILELQAELIKKGIIPDDVFIKNIFKNIESIFAQERKDKGDPHPKKEYAIEQNARLILNLAMVYIQHFVQIKK